MAQVRTAISLQKPLFEEVDALCRELQVSRSRLFVWAVEEFIQRRQSQKLLEAINAAYSDVPDSEEKTLRQEMRRQHRQLVEGQW